MSTDDNYPEEITIMLSDFNDLEVGSKLVKNKIPYATVTRVNSDKVEISFIYPAELEGVTVIYKATPSAQRNGDDSILLTLIENKKNKILKEAVSRDQQPQRFCFSKEQLRDVIFIAAKKAIKKNGLMSFNAFLERINSINRAQSGDLNKKK